MGEEEEEEEENEDIKSSYIIGSGRGSGFRLILSFRIRRGGG